MSYQLLSVEFDKWYVSDTGTVGRRTEVGSVTINPGRNDSRLAGPCDDEAAANAKMAELIEADSGLRGRLYVWKSATAREERRGKLERATDEQLKYVVEKLFGEGVTFARKERMIDTILDEEFPGPRQTTEMLNCSRCGRRRPHRTPATLREIDGKQVQQMQCAVCDTWTIVPTENFQANVDTPDETDFSDVK